MYIYIYIYEKCWKSVERSLLLLTTLQMYLQIWYLHTVVTQFENDHIRLQDYTCNPSQCR